MTARPEQEARIRAIGAASIEIIEAVRLIGQANNLSPEDTLAALTLASASIDNAMDLIAELKDLPHGSRSPL